MVVTIGLGGHLHIIDFPDGQPHVQLKDISEGDVVRVVWPITSPRSLLQLMEIANALDGLFAVKALLVIPYLMGARSDRHMVPGDSCDLAVIAGAINSCGFEKVYIFDVHSDVALQLIHRSVNIDNGFLLDRYEHKNDNPLLIVPDAGGIKRADRYAERLGITELVQCTKVRNSATGRISIRVLEPAHTENRHCVIVDDLCDGGATFVEIAKQIFPRPSTLTLIISHGVFSRGFEVFKDHIDKIIVSNSYPIGAIPEFVEVVALPVSSYL